MRTILLGGNGFIGINLARYLDAYSNDPIIIVGRRKEVAIFSTLRKCIYIQGDYTNLLLLASIIQEEDNVIFLAYNSVPKTSFDDPLKDVNENLVGAVNLFSFLKERRINKLLYVSSGGTVYGKTEEEIIREDHVCNPISPYGITKLTIEKYAHFFAELYELPVIIARPGNPFGPYQNSNGNQGFIAAAMRATLKNSEINVYGKSGTIRDYIYIDDLSKALHLLLASDYCKAEIFNIGRGIGYNNQQIIGMINSIAVNDGYQCRATYIEERKFDVPFNVLNCTKLISLGWNSDYNFEKALKLTWEWYLQNND